MSYVMNRACNPQALAEQEFTTPSGLLDYVITTMFTSCIGVAVRVDSKFTVAHLVNTGERIPAPENDFPIPFNNEDALHVFEILDAVRASKGSEEEYNEVIFFGFVDDWQEDEGYKVLRSLLAEKSAKDPKELLLHEDNRIGRYYVRIAGENLAVTNIDLCEHSFA